VECVVNVVFCVVVFGLQKTCQLFEIYFLVFPFWECDVGERHAPCGGLDWGAKADASAFLEATATATTDCFRE
jgi:hypothetical protein